MSKTSVTIVIVEDDRHKMLIFRYLRKRGLTGHEIRIELSPSGTGSAESWVRKRFVVETNVYRTRQAKTQLIVLIDADVSTVQSRLSQLDSALRDGGYRPVDPGERIARLVPRRNVETWILALNDNPVDEVTDYKNSRDRWTQRIPTAAERLCQWTRHAAGPPHGCIASLKAGVNELKRLSY